MTRVKGILHGKSTVELLEPVDAPEGCEVEVIVETSEKDREQAIQWLVRQMEKGFPTSKRILKWSREEVYER